MRISKKHSTVQITRKILSALETEPFFEMHAIGKDALLVATLALEKAQEWQHTTFTVEHSRYVTETKKGQQEVHVLAVYR